jgi:hypothetical protein
MIVIQGSGLCQTRYARAASIAMSSATIESPAAQAEIGLRVMAFSLPSSIAAMPPLAFLEVASVYKVCLSFSGILARNR